MASASLLLEHVRVDLADDGRPAWHPDDEVQPREHRLGHAGAVKSIDARPPRAPVRIVLHPQPHLGRVAVAGQVDQAGQVAAVGVLAHEQPQLAALLQVQHGLQGRQQLLDRRLEQLVARIGLQHVEQGLAAVARRVEARAARAPPSALRRSTGICVTLSV